MITEENNMNNLKGIFFVLVFVMITQLAFCQVVRIDKVDTWIKSCMSEVDGSTTMGMRECYIQGQHKMDSLLNIVYRQLMKQLKPDDQERLRNSQRNWLKFLESEKAFTGEVFRSWANESKYQYGSQINVTEAGFVYGLMKERVLRLMDYIEAE